MALGALLVRSGCHVPAMPWHCLLHTFASHYRIAHAAGGPDRVTATLRRDIP